MRAQLRANLPEMSKKAVAQKRLRTQATDIPEKSKA